MRLTGRTSSALGLLAVLAAAALLAGGHPAAAQSSLGIGTAEVTSQPSGPFAGLLIAVAGLQRTFFTDLRHALVAIRSGSGGLLWLTALSFAYGVFHAAGPGHGKAVISSYMLANEVELRRGILLSFVSALLQALSALVLVGAGWYLLRGTALSMTEAAYGLELASYALVALCGAWLLQRKVRAILARRPASFARLAAGGGLAFAGPGTFSGARVLGGSPAPVMAPASGGYARGICDDPAGDACDCGRAHMPDPRRLGGARLGLRSGASAVFAVGLRPCSGAIVVLTFALTNGLVLGGVLSVLAMALGTAVTVSALAALAVFAKDFALRLGRRGRIGGIVGDAIEIAGAGLLVLLGLILLAASLEA